MRFLKQVPTKMQIFIFLLAAEIISRSSRDIENDFNKLSVAKRDHLKSMSESEVADRHSEHIASELRESHKGIASYNLRIFYYCG